jgi:thiamine pyrophosphate-dependent acetolactate synthase large subunit-like protein
MSDNLERPVSLPSGNALFGSDVVAETLRALDIPYIALNPGASYRGLHDSIVNHMGNTAPQMLLCLHEETAVAICQGYAKVTGKPLAAAVHSNVGLFHATMAMFNAWCDRMPVLVLGATGPVDARARSFATTPSGTTSQPRRKLRVSRYCVLTGSPAPRRWDRCT